MQLQHLNPAFVTPLKSCSRTKRALFLHCVLLILLGSEQYGAYSRKLLLKLAISLDAPVWVLSNDEIRFASASSKIIRGIPIEEILQRRAEESKPGMRRFRSQMNSATLGGENAGKLAAPLAASRIGTVFAGYGLQPAATTALIGPLNESTVAIGTLFGLYGARQGSKSMEAHGKDVLDLAMIPLHLPYNPGLIDPKDVPTDSRKLRVTIAVSGLLTSNQDLRESWNFLGQQNEVYVMRWELEALSKMGTSFEILGKSLAWDEAKKEITSRTVFDRLRDSLWPYSLMKISKIIDQPWTIGMTRAEKAGQVLADTIMNKMYGERPISLAGYSFGARVIYVCMMILAEKRAFGLLENVILIGAPCPADIPCWVSLRSVCVGRLINVFSPQDYLLGFLHRSSAWMYGVAGLQEIMGVPNVENFNASHFAASHLRYHYLVGTILKKLNWEDVDYQQVALQQDKLNELIDIEDNFVASRIQQRDAKAKQAAQEEAKEQPEEQGLQDVTNKFRRTNLGPERRR
ncbi:hypothetical protein M426DRAFT_138399 [Hypoxylon sp. CI-4A]|nr:hypothetical protein M426DRAFT_138399 [Hypoxylon sp. CI-4A]